MLVLLLSAIDWHHNHPDKALYQNTTKKQSIPQILATPSGYGNLEDLDNDQVSERQDLENTMSDGESSVEMEVMELTPVKRTKTKVGAKGGKKANVSKLQDNIKVIHKVPNSEIGLMVGDSPFDDNVRQLWKSFRAMWAANKHKFSHVFPPCHQHNLTIFSQLQLWEAYHKEGHNK